MNRNIVKYCRKVSWQLSCKRQTKRNLLNGLSEELDEGQFESYEDIVRQYGSPAEIAAQLQETVSPEEAHSAKVGARIRLITTIIAIALVLAGLFAWYAHYRNEIDPVYYTTYIAEGDEPFPGSDQIIWGPEN